MQNVSEYTLVLALCLVYCRCAGVDVDAGAVAGVVGQVLLANADALCAAATPLVASEEINL